ncbi:MAG TPA: prephenate dehydratase [Dehalococcoidia bacterium]|nr:prephenate dehydratase [Dehalococcoidia bacterium]
MTRRVGYLGPPGSFGEQAALLYEPDSQLVAFTTHTAIVEAVQTAVIEEGVVAIENSIQGAILETIDALIVATNVFIRGEPVLPVTHNLIAARGTSLADIQVVMSHPQALGQCHRFIDNMLPGIRLDAALSTSGAVEEAVRTRGYAAIGTLRAAELYGGEVLATGIQDAKNNKTRFFLLARQDAEPTGDDKTSVVFEVPDRPGSLVEVLAELASRGINLSHIESRPSREQLGKYVFLIDFHGHRLDHKPREALNAIKALGARLLPGDRPLGSYPRFIEA